MSAAERAYADTLRKQLDVRDIEVAQLRHELAELRAVEVDLRRENAALREDRARLDWLQSHATTDIGWEDGGICGGWEGYGVPLREAIDIARGKAGE